MILNMAVIGEEASSTSVEQDSFGPFWNVSVCWVWTDRQSCGEAWGPAPSSVFNTENVGVYLM